MKNDTPAGILTEIYQMSLAQQTVQQNRARINRLFNGDTPNTSEELREQNGKTNVNWLEGSNIATNSTNQLNNAFFGGERFFTVRLDRGPMQWRTQWGGSITKYINRELKRSRQYEASRESAHAQVVLHGPGPGVWRDRKCPIPDMIGVDDILIPAGTYTSMSNLDSLCIYRELTWAQLYDATQGENVDPGWNQPYIKAILANMYTKGLQPIYQGNRWMFPEKIQEDIKEGASLMMSGALPRALCWEYLYRDEDSEKWNRRIMLDYGNVSPTDSNPRRQVNKEIEGKDVDRNRDFLYKKDGYADDWSNVIHWYIGNCSNVAPYRYHSVRSIGYLLYGVCMVQNKLRCRLTDHMMQQLLTWFRNVSDDDREKLGLIDLQNFGVFPDGVSMVTAQERHVADWQLIVMGLNQGRQLMAESSSSFVPDTQGESSNAPMTATEALIRQNQSITLTSAVLKQISKQSKAEYMEICRRFCIKDNPSKEAKRFRENIQREGVPLQMLDCEGWDIIPEQVVGGGSKAMELTVTQALLQEIAPAVGPEAQRIILRRRTLALTDNSMDALEIVPNAPEPPGDDVQYAQTAFSGLMMGVPWIVKEGINRPVYVATLMQLMQGIMQQVQGLIGQPAGLGIAADRVAGLFNVANHVQQNIQLIGQDPREQDKAKVIFKAFEQLMQMLQQFAKQLQAMEEEQAQQQGGQGVSPEAQAKIIDMHATSQAKNQIAVMNAQTKNQHKDITFANENMRRNAMTQADVHRGDIKTIADVHRTAALTHADVAAKDLTTAGDIIRTDREAKAAPAAE